MYPDLILNKIVFDFSSKLLFKINNIRISLKTSH